MKFRIFSIERKQTEREYSTKPETTVQMVCDETQATITLTEQYGGVVRYGVGQEFDLVARK